MVRCKEDGFSGCEPPLARGEAISHLGNRLAQVGRTAVAPNPVWALAELLHLLLLKKAFAPGVRQEITNFRLLDTLLQGAPLASVGRMRKDLFC